MITIVSKENESVEFDQRIVEYARSLELYEQDKPIVFEEIITVEFLKSMKRFYEEADFNEEKLKMKPEPIKSNTLSSILNAEHLSIMEPFFKKAQKVKSLSPFVELLQGADMLRAKHFKDLVCCTIATLFYCTGTSEFDIKKYREFWSLGDKDTTFPSYSNTSFFYLSFTEKLMFNYNNKLNKLFNSENDDKKQSKDNETLGQKIQDQLELVM